MSCLVIGGDKLGNIPEQLRLKGFDRVEHIDGRRKKHKSLDVPENTDLVLVLTDFVGHQIVKVTKEKCKKSNAVVLFSKRSWNCIEMQLEEFLRFKK